MERIALHPQGTGIAVADPGGGVDWLATRGPADRRLTLPDLAVPVSALACSGDGSELLVAAAGGPVLVHDLLRGGRRLWSLPHPAAVVRCAAVARRRYATVDRRFAVRVWTPSGTGAPVAKTLDVERPVGALALREQGRELCLQSAFDLVRYDLETGEPRERRQLLDGTWLDAMEGQIVFSPDGGTLLIYWDDGRIADVASGAELHRFPFSRHAGGAAVSDSGRRYALGLSDGTLLVADVERGPLLERPVTGAEIVEVEMSAAGDVVAFADAQGRCGVLDCERDAWLLAPEQVGELRQT